MPAYHSIYLKAKGFKEIGNFPIFDLRGDRAKFPAPKLPYVPEARKEEDQDKPEIPPDDLYDCVDEILLVFRANVLFRNFEIKGPADRVLIYGTLFISECLGKIDTLWSSAEAQRALSNIARSEFAIPGDATFPLNQIFAPPGAGNEADLRNHIWKLRQAIATGLHAMLYADGAGPSKYWLSFAKRKFMGKSLEKSL